MESREQILMTMVLFPFIMMVILYEGGVVTLNVRDYCTFSRENTVRSISSRTVTGMIMIQ